MSTQRYKSAVFLGFTLWLLFLLINHFDTSSGPDNTRLSMPPLLFAGDGGAYSRIQSTYTTCDTSIADTKKALEKPNQSKVFFMDSTWWMLALRNSTNKWNLWRYDSVRTWTPVLEFTNSNKDRPDAYPDYAASRVLVFFSSKTSSSTLKNLSYDAFSKSWTLTSSTTVPVIKSVGDDPASFVVAKNGHLWAFMASGSKVSGVTSADGGATWSSEIILVDSTNVASGLTDAVAFTDSGGVDCIGVGIGENSSSTSKFRFLKHVDSDPDGIWKDETSELDELTTENSDDHISMAVDKDNAVYMVTKTKGGGPITPENTLYKRGKGITVSDTNIVNTKKGLEKPNQTKIFYHAGRWWILAIKKSSNLWTLWRYDGGLDWIPVYEFSISVKTHPDVYIDNTLGELHVFFSDNSASQIWNMVYDPSSLSFVLLSSYAVPDVVTTGDDPASFTVAKNGDFWAFTATGSKLLGVKSSDGGATWTSAITILDPITSSNGLTDAIAFTGDNGRNYLALGLAENSATSSRFRFFIHDDDSADGTWVDESSNVGAISSERGDDHLHLAVDKHNNVYMITKTTGGGTGTPENVLYKRFADSTWASYVVIDGIDWTRPALVVDSQDDSLYIFGTRESVSLGKILEYKKVAIGEEATLAAAPRLTAIENGLEEMVNVSVPGKAVYDSTDLFIITDNGDLNEVWFTKFGIGTTRVPIVIKRWKKFIVIEGVDWTRPAVVIDQQFDSLYVIGTRESPSIGKVLEYKRCKIGEEATLIEEALRTEIMANGLNTFFNVSVPAHAVYDSTELMLIVDNDTENTVWFRRLPIGTAPPCPSYIDTSITSLTITKVGGDVKLDWTFVAEADSYVVYSSTRPMFDVADSSRLAATLTNTYTHVGALGDPKVNHFYVVRAYVAGSPGPLSNRVAEYEYELLAPAGKRNNFVALCVNDTSLKMASDLADRIGPNCDLVSRWVEASQAFSSFVPGIPALDFALELNEVYMVSVTTADTLCLAGAVVTGHQYSMITTGGKNNNGIMVLMDTDSLSLASKLAAAIGPVDLVSRWVAASQAYSSYVPGIEVLDFPIVPGQPLMVSVTADTTWPQR